MENIFKFVQNGIHDDADRKRQVGIFEVVQCQIPCSLGNQRPVCQIAGNSGQQRLRQNGKPGPTGGQIKKKLDLTAGTDYVGMRMIIFTGAHKLLVDKGILSGRQNILVVQIGYMNLIALCQRVFFRKNNVKC